MACEVVLVVVMVGWHRVGLVPLSIVAPFEGVPDQGYVRVMWIVMMRYCVRRTQCCVLG